MVVFGNLGTILEIETPKKFFDSSDNKHVLNKVVDLVNRSFGRNLEYGDIYAHVTSPDKVYLMTGSDSSIVAMGGYSKKILSGMPSVYVDGIVVDPSFQGREVFREITDRAMDGENLLCLRTQSPIMYRAMQKYCSVVYPNSGDMPQGIKEVRNDLAKYLKSRLNSRGVIEGHYGGMFYGKEPTHPSVSNFFREGLNMDISKGDAVLVIGVIR